MNLKQMGLGLALVLLLAAEPEGRAGVTAFLNIDGVAGEATDYWHPNWIVVLAMTNNVVMGSAPGRVPLLTSTLVVEKELDKASPQLCLAARSGQPFKEMTIECCAMHTTNNLAFYRINLRNVVVRSVEQYATSVGSSSRPYERIVLGYNRISWIYTSAVSSMASPERFGTYWDLVRNRGGVLPPAPVFQVTGIQQQPGQVVLNWPAQQGKRYRIFSSPQVDGTFSFLAEMTASLTQSTTYAVPFVGDAMFFFVEESP